MKNQSLDGSSKIEVNFKTCIHMEECYNLVIVTLIHSLLPAFIALISYVPSKSRL